MISSSINVCGGQVYLQPSCEKGVANKRFCNESAIPKPVNEALLFISPKNIDSIPFIPLFVLKFKIKSHFKECQ